MAENIPSRYRKKSKQTPQLYIQTSQLPSPQLTDDSDEPGLSATSLASNWSVSTPTSNNLPSIPISIKLPTQVVYKFISQSTSVNKLLNDVISEHRYELGQDPEDFMLWEVYGDSKVTINRPLRSCEHLKHIARSWGIEGVENKSAISSTCVNISVTPSSFKLDSSSIASLTPRRDIIKECPKFSTTLYWCTGGINSKKSSWKKCQVKIKNNCIWITNTSSNIDRSLTIDEFDLYEGFTPVKESKYIISLRSQLSPQYFDNLSDTLHHFTTNNEEDYSLFKNIIYSLRNQSVEKLSRKYATSLEDKNQKIENTNNINYQQRQLIDECHSPPNSSTSTFSTTAVPLSRGKSTSSQSNKYPFSSESLLGNQYNYKTSPTSKRTSPPFNSSPFTPDSLLGNQYQRKASSTSIKSPLDRQPLKLKPASLVTSNYQLPNHSMALLHRAK